MTKAEQWRASKPVDWKDAAEYFQQLFNLDPEAVVQSTNLGPVIKFTDGSMHRMGGA